MNRFRNLAQKINEKAADPRHKLISTSTRHLLKANADAVKILGLAKSSYGRKMAQDIINANNKLQGALKKMGDELKEDVMNESENLDESAKK